jgi:hypothetical protein
MDAAQRKELMTRLTSLNNDVTVNRVAQRDRSAAAPTPDTLRLDTGDLVSIRPEARQAPKSEVPAALTQGLAQNFSLQ